MSENQGRRIEDSEERRGFPWGWLIAGIIILLLLAFMVPFACSALTGSNGGGAGGGGGEDTNGSESAGGAGGEETTSGGAATSGETAPEGTASEGTISEGTTSEGTAPEESINAGVASFGTVEGDGTSVMVPEASVSGVEGWMVIRDAGGEEGTILGHAPLAEGSNTDIEVPLDEPVESGELYAMVHADDPADGEFTYPDGDPPIRSAEGIAVEPFTYAVADAPDDETAGSENVSDEEAASDGEEIVPANGEPLPQTGGTSAAVASMAGGALLALIGASFVLWVNRRGYRV